MRPSVISAVGHVALRVRDLDAAVQRATTMMGLRVSARRPDVVDLTHGAPRLSLRLLQGSEDAFDHLGLIAEGAGAIGEIRRRLERAAVPLLSDRPFSDDLEAGLAFALGGRIAVEVYWGMAADQPEYVGTGVCPTRLGHVNVYVPEPGPALEQLTELLDFRVSDRIRGGAFTRCNEDHHAIAVLPGDHKLHHHAWQVQSIADLGRLGDALHASGDALLEGPVRHGIGNNIAAYFRGFAGEAVEYYTDMERIHDDAAREPGDWTTDGTAWYSLWTPRLPLDDFRHLGAPLSPLAADGRAPDRASEARTSSR